MSVIDDAKCVAREFPEDSGYVVAFSNPRTIQSSPEWRVLFLKKFKGLTADVVGGSLEDAHLYPTWQEAAADARSWVHSNKSSTRIIFVRRSRPYTIGDDFPIGVLDALAEV